jgi:glycosyltransferase involved in cell wall biosynthesis
VIILHLCHGFYPGNGLESFLLNLCNNDRDNKNIIIVPQGMNKDIGLNPDIDVLEITDFFQVADIVDKIQPDIFLIHWTGAEALIKEECTLILSGSKYYYKLKPGIKRDINNDPFGFLYVSKLINSVPLYIIAHSEFEIPMHIQDPEITGLIAVSNKALKAFKKNNFKRMAIPNGIDTEAFKPKRVDRISKNLLSVGLVI